MGTREGRGTGRRKGCLTPLLNKQMLEVRQPGQYAGGCKGLFLFNDGDHRRVQVVEQVLSEVREG